MSNETPEATGTPDIDQSVRSALTGVADQVDIGMVDDTLAEVHTLVHRRRRRRNALVGTAAAATLVVGGVVVANVAGNDGSGNDLIVSAPVTDPVDAPTDGDDEPVADTAPDNSIAPAESTPAPVVEMSSAGAATAETIAADDRFVQGSYQQLLPWQNGFLVIGQTQVDQALPSELPDEINEAFPPEIIQFFEDAGGLPPTISEATTMLQEAGLYDIVSQVVLDNPDVFDAIYSVPMEPPVSFARISDDGNNWTDVDLDVPFDPYGDRRIFSTGDRLAIVSLVYEEDVLAATDPSTSPPQAVAIVVQTTTDLQTWSTQRSEITPSISDLPVYITENTYLNGVAVNNAGWVASVDSYQNVDYEALLPDDFDRSFMESEFGWGMYHDQDGLIIDTYTERGDSEQRHVPWSELGFAEPPVGIDIDFEGGSQAGTSWSAQWGAEATQAAAVPGDFGYGPMIGFDGGFVRQGERPSFSPDGVTWTDFDRPVENGWVNTFMAVPDGLIGFVQHDDGSSAVYHLDVASLTWTPAEEPAIPDGFSPWSDAANGAVLYSIEDYSYYDDGGYGEPFVISVENVDYILDGTFSNDSQSYTLTERASGDVVVSESFDSGEYDLFEHLIELDEGVEIRSPDTGDVITVFTADDLETSMSSDAPPSTDVANDVPTETTVGFEDVAYEVSPAEVSEYVQPQLNVLATNGEVWINQALDVGTPTLPTPGTDPTMLEPNYPSEVVVNGGVVLVSMSDGSFVRLTF